MKTGHLVLWRLGAAAGAALLAGAYLSAIHAGGDSAAGAVGAAMLVFFFHPLRLGKQDSGSPKSDSK